MKISVAPCRISAISVFPQTYLGGQAPLMVNSALGGEEGKGKAEESTADIGESGHQGVDIRLPGDQARGEASAGQRYLARSGGLRAGFRFLSAL